MADFQRFLSEFYQPNCLVLSTERVSLLRKPRSKSTADKTFSPLENCCGLSEISRALTTQKLKNSAGFSTRNKGSSLKSATSISISPIPTTTNRSNLI